MSTPKQKNFSAAQLEAMAGLFRALAEPGRLTLLHALQGGPMSVNELVETCAMKQANVSKHLGVLHDCRLVKRKRNGTCIHYAIADPMVFALCKLVCGKMQRDAGAAAELFAPDI